MGVRLLLRTVPKKNLFKKHRQRIWKGEIYRTIAKELSSEAVQQNIRENFPKATIHRRNTGYAIDALLDNQVLGTSQKPLNICQLLTGSEGTLAITTQITLQLDELPPVVGAMVAAHFSTITECMEAVVPVMEHALYTCEMMDKVVLDCTMDNIEQAKNRFFVQGDPQAILMLEVRAHTKECLEIQIQQLIETLLGQTKAYAYPILRGAEIDQALELRKAGLGLLGNLIGDKKAVACIEDTAVALPDLANYIAEFTELMQSFDQNAVYYAHAGAGEIHLRPILNLKSGSGVRDFKIITDRVASLVKKYRGSMSGEHGDGIVRSRYIPEMIGQKNYEILTCIKTAFDPNHILNPGKIIDGLAMDQHLRYEVDRNEPLINTLMDFADKKGILRMAESCNGSGDCRKSVAAGGTMCPSYRATKNEKDTTRGRANALREFITNSTQPNKFDHVELKQVFDLCISCKGCSSECPSGVDVATLKAEFEYQYQKTNGYSLRSKLFANNSRLNAIGSKVPGLANFGFTNTIISGLLKRSFGIAPKRNLPKLTSNTLRHWIQTELAHLQPAKPIKSIYFFVDEFTNHLDVEVGKDALKVLTKLGYLVKTVLHSESGRGFISKGFLEEAKNLAEENVAIFAPIVTAETPLIGIEPSAILTFRDEYKRLCDAKKAAQSLAEHTYLIDEFLKAEIQSGVITANQCTKANLKIKLHGHCHQKALSNIEATFSYLNLPENYEVRIIPSGCCGMAGSFGYEKEHYAISMQIGEQTLFPAVRNAAESTAIAATGTSCRHQIVDGTGRQAQHPISIFLEALQDDDSL